MGIDEQKKAAPNAGGLVIVHKWTEKEIRFIKAKTAGSSYAKVRELFNKHFCLSLTFNQILYGIRKYTQGNGLDSRYSPGHPNYNSYIKGMRISSKTEFKSGHKSYSSKPIGSERKDDRGFTVVKTAEPDVWKRKHEVIWESANGPIPKGHIVIFADRNKSNFAINNLVLVSRANLMIMNRLGLFVCDTDLTKIGKSVSDILIMINERSSKKNKE
jgi:hypothetical protein